MSLDIAFAKRLTEKPELMARLRAGRLFQLSGGCWGGEVSGAHLNADEAGADDNGTNAEDNVDGDGPRSSDDEDDNERNDDEHNDDEGNDDEVASLNDGPDTDKEGEEPNDHANAKRGKIRGRKRALNTLLVAPLIMGNADGSVVSVMAETSAAAETTVTSSMATTETLSTPTTATPPNKSTPTLVEFINNHCASKSYTPRNLPPETEYYKRKRLKEEKKNLSTSSAATQGAPSASTASPVDKTPQIARRRNASHHAGALACDEWFAWLTAIQSTFAWSPLETLK